MNLTILKFKIFFYNTFLLYAKNQKEKTSWMKAINDAISKLRDSSPELADINSKTAAVWAADSSGTHCTLKGCNREFNLICRRHHCRLCGALVCDKCSKHREILPHIDLKKKQRICNICKPTLTKERNSSS